MLLKFKNLKLNCFTFDETDSTGIYEFSNGNCIVNLVSKNLDFNFASNYEVTLSDDMGKFNVVGCMVDTDYKVYVSLKDSTNDVERVEMNITSVTAVEELRKFVKVNSQVYFGIKSV